MHIAVCISKQLNRITVYSTMYNTKQIVSKEEEQESESFYTVDGRHNNTICIYAIPLSERISCVTVLCNLIKKTVL